MWETGLLELSSWFFLGEGSSKLKEKNVLMPIAERKVTHSILQHHLHYLIDIDCDFY